MSTAQSFLDLARWRKALYSADLSPTAKTIGAYLSDRVHSQFGYAWPHIKTVAAECRLALATVKRALRELKRQGFILIQSGLGWHSSRYWCLLPCGVSADTAVGSVVTPPIEETNLNFDLLPPPQESVTIASPEATPEPLSEPETASEPQTPVMASPEPENAPQADSDPEDEALAVIVALIAASGAKYSTKPGSGPMRSAERALRVATVEDLKLVISWCAATWSNPKFLTPSAVLKPSKLEERIAAAKASAPAGTRAACHKPFEPDKPIERTPPDRARGHIAALKAALTG